MMRLSNKVNSIRLKGTNVRPNTSAAAIVISSGVSIRYQIEQKYISFLVSVKKMYIAPAVFQIKYSNVKQSPVFFKNDVINPPVKLLYLFFCGLFIRPFLMPLLGFKKNHVIQRLQ